MIVIQRLNHMGWQVPKGSISLIPERVQIPENKTNIGGKTKKHWNILLFPYPIPRPWNKNIIKTDRSRNKKEAWYQCKNGLKAKPMDLSSSHRIKENVRQPHA